MTKSVNKALVNILLIDMDQCW